MAAKEEGKAAWHAELGREEFSLIPGVPNPADAWKTSALSPDGTHHLARDGQPLYSRRFHEVLKFHPPGLAPARDGSGAYHITPEGMAAYEDRHRRTFGFYEGRAAVDAEDGWLHILPDGRQLYPGRYSWCGNFQGGRCAIRRSDGSYLHITLDGGPAYSQRYRYAGDFRDGLAVTQRADGRHSHIDCRGGLLHGRWFLDLDVYHKGYARARDDAGWCHVDLMGMPLYQHRFRAVEPFYNGQARVEGFDGSLSVIDETGKTVLQLRPALRSPLEELSADMVGLWKTQTIRATVELGVFEVLPASAEEVEKRLQLIESGGRRLMRALVELGLTLRDGDGVYYATERGSHLRRSHPLSLADAALHWGRESYQAWDRLLHALETGSPGFAELEGTGFFEWLRARPEGLRGYHEAMASYARHDYEAVAHAVDLRGHSSVLDAGGGSGELSFALLRVFPELTAAIMDRPEVVRMAAVPEDVVDRCSIIAGDLFQEWPARSDAVLLARVLHDWPDDDALRILRRAREAMPIGGSLYVVEMVLGETVPGGGLMDLHMLVMTGGMERTERQFADLFDRAGFRLVDVAPTGSVSSVIRALAV